MNVEAPSAGPVSSSDGNPVRNPLLVVISAPSGGGKTTVCQQLLESSPSMSRAVTCTTRAPRGQEQNGIDYYFLDHETFLKRVQAGHFLEHATVYGNSYGTLKSEVLDKLRQGKDVLLNIDVQGAASVREQARDDAELRRALVSIFLTPPSMAVLETRLRRRATDSEQVIQTRLAVARHELAHWKNFDYLLISGTIPEDLRRAQLILEAERMKSYRSRAPEF